VSASARREAYLLQRESAEEHLRQLTATLENRVRDRMGDLRAANQRLVREMDERKGAEARLRESEELYRYTVELTRQMAWTANPDGSMVTVSQRFYDMTGSDPSLLPHEAWLQVIHPDDLELVNARWERSLATGEDHVVAFRMRVADGSYRFVARARPRAGTRAAGSSDGTAIPKTFTSASRWRPPGRRLRRGCAKAKSSIVRPSSSARESSGRPPRTARSRA
jgi:PAS domain S-box-containing protein